jgi:aspartokinase
MDERRSDDHGSGRRKRLGGIKFSELQTRVVLAPEAGMSDITALLETCYRNRINLTQLFLGAASSAACDFCIDDRDYQQAAHLLDPALSEICADSGRTRSVGRLTLFPHNYEFSVVIGALKRLAESNLPVYCAYSSLSALSIATDYQLMDRMAESLLEVFELPEGHSPFRYEPSELDVRLAGGEGRKIETIATYWEPVIKIYGSNLKTGVTALSVSFSALHLLPVLSFLSDVEEVDSFKVIALNTADQNSNNLLLLVTTAVGIKLVKSLRRRFDQSGGVAIAEQPGLEVVYFHGPHFQDRYGVANAVVKTIEKANVECVFLNCSGTSIFLVTPAHVGSLAQKALEKVFMVP